MKTKFCTVLAIAVFGSSFALNAQSNSIKQTTPEYIYPTFRNVLKMAEENSVRYQKMDVGLLNAKYSKAISLSDRYPSVRLSTGAGAYWSDYKNPNTGETEGAAFGVNDLSLSTGYNLYTWGSKAAGHRKTERNYQRQLIEYEGQMSSIARDLRNRFLQLIMDKFALKTLELEIAINQANINEDTVRYEQGRLSSENYDRSMNSRKSRLLDLEKMRRNIDRGIQDFNTVIGIENAMTLDDIPTTVPVVENVNDQLIALARQSENKSYSDIPAVMKAQIDVDQADDSIIQARSLTKPSIGLSGGVSLDVEPTQGNQRVIEFRAGLGVGWNIYSGGANTKRILRSLNDRTVELADYRYLLQQTKIDLDRNVEDLLYNYNKLEIAESEYQLALQSYEKSKDEYERGRVSELQFMNIELGRLYQERSIYNTRKQYILAITDFLSTLGKDPVLEILTRPEEKDLSYIEGSY